MRDIKFRGKRLDSDEWAYGSLILTNGNNEFATRMQPYDACNYAPPVDPDTVGEYTGLKDKNGVMIYEGDIVKIVEVSNQGLKEYTTPIKYEDCAFVVQSGKDDYDTFLAAWCGEDGYPLYEIEVIGNIYQGTGEVQP